jgi:hypothetical protein
LDEEMVRLIRDGHEVTDASYIYAERLHDEVISTLSNEQRKRYDEWIKEGTSRSREETAAQDAERLAREFGLTPDQTERASEALRSAEQAFWDDFESTFGLVPGRSVDDLLSKRDRQRKEAMKAILTPSQYAAYEGKVDVE